MFRLQDYPEDTHDLLAAYMPRRNDDDRPPTPAGLAALTPKPPPVPVVDFSQDAPLQPSPDGRTNGATAAPARTGSMLLSEGLPGFAGALAQIVHRTAEAATWTCDYCAQPVRPYTLGSEGNPRFIPKPYCDCDEDRLRWALVKASSSAIEQDLDRFAGRVRLWQALQLDYFAGWTFDTFLTDTPARRKARDAWQGKLLPGLKQGAWAMVTGPYSTGKTHLAYATAHDVVLSLGRRALVLNWISFIEAYKETWDRSRNGGQPSDQATGADLFVQARNAWLLIIDDFDKELPLYENVKGQLKRPYGNGSQVAWWLRQFYRLLDDRYLYSRREPRPTLVIANQPWDHVGSLLRWMGGTTGAAALDRLDRIGASSLDFAAYQVEPWRDEPIF